MIMIRLAREHQRRLMKSHSPSRSLKTRNKLVLGIDAARGCRAASSSRLGLGSKDASIECRLFPSCDREGPSTIPPLSFIILLFVTQTLYKLPVSTRSIVESTVYLPILNCLSPEGFVPDIGLNNMRRWALPHPRGMEAFVPPISRNPAPTGREHLCFSNRSPKGRQQPHFAKLSSPNEATNLVSRNRAPK